MQTQGELHLHHSHVSQHCYVLALRLEIVLLVKNNPLEPFWHLGSSLFHPRRCVGCAKPSWHYWLSRWETVALGAKWEQQTKG